MSAYRRARPSSGSARAVIYTPAAAKPLTPAPSEFPMVLTDEEAAGLLRIRREVIIDALRDHELPGNNVGGHWRVRTEALLIWLDGPYGSVRRQADE